MNKLVLVIVIGFAFLFGNMANAQVLDPDYGPRAWKKENTKQEEPIELNHIRQADVTWAKRVWREIDLRQKQNLVLYYPLDSATLGKRSFIQLLADMVRESYLSPGPDALKVYTSYELKNLMPLDELKNKLSFTDTVSVLIDPENCIIERLPKSVDFLNEGKPLVTKVEIMEDWFFDKQRSVMDVRILALGIKVPTFESGVALNVVCGENAFTGFKPIDNGEEILWFFFPDLRHEMATNEIYNRHNDAHRTSFDDLFLKRMFSSYIVKEENVYDRYILDYTSGMDALLEAEKISEKIREYEMDFWEY